jgi:hypothetical protein
MNAGDDSMARYPREVGGAGLTNLQGDTFERVMLVQSTTSSALIRRALNELFIREGYLTIEQLAAEAADNTRGAKNGSTP